MSTVEAVPLNGGTSQAIDNLLVDKVCEVPILIPQVKLKSIDMDAHVLTLLNKVTIPAVALGWR